LGDQKRLIVAFGKSNEIKESSDSIEVIVKKSAKSKQEQQSHSAKNIASIATSPSAEQVKKRLEAWLKAKASDYILDKVTEYSEQLVLYPKIVNIRQYKARWGSCNNRGELSFNYLLMMAPNWVIDYVIIHELCHLKYLNHSSSFWQLVQCHCPYYKDAKLWLKANQTNLYWSL
jgi:predicted metal-dependent hydrolase